jgi:hypothetical protein
MPRGVKLMLPFADWPAEDRKRWKSAFKSGDRFDESARGSHLAASTRKSLQEGYGRFARFLSDNHQDLIILPPEARIDRRLVAEYVTWRRRSCGELMVVADLDLLRSALKLFSPDTDWSWL